MRYLYILIFPLLLFANEALMPIPKKVVFEKEKGKLGKKLFFDTTLSKDNSVACVSCHNIFNGGADPRAVSTGFEGRKGNIQSPTVLNAVFNFRQFWNGRANDLKEQAAGPLNNPVEHNMTPQLVVTRVKNNPEYVRSFKKLYKDGVTYENILDAIVEFEKALVTPDSKFDKFLRHEVELTPSEARGYTLFKQYGCISCHNGINMGGNSFAKIGMFEPYPSKKRYPDRFEITHDKIDINVFKVPTLRNIALTAPYFHDASQKTLENAIQAMAYYNLGLEFETKDLEDIANFLKTLTGVLPEIAYE